MYSLNFSINCKKTKEISEKPNNVSCAIDEPRKKPKLFETLEVDKVKRLKNPHHWLLRDIAQI